MKRRAWFVAVLFGAALVLAGAATVLRRTEWRPTHRPTLPDVTARRVDPLPVMAVQARAAARAQTTDKAASDVLPASLDGTDVDGALAVDAQGRVLVNPETRAFFDYFLTATGEESPAQIRARIVAAIESRLPRDAAHAAIDLLDRYLTYRDRAQRVPAAATTPEERLQQLHALRRAVFGVADAEALFADEDARDGVTVERLRLAADPSLSAEERQARVQALEAQLPESERAARNAALLPAQLARDEAQLRAAGGSDAEVRTLREAAVGPEGADRLEALDRQRADWQARVDQYRAERDSIEQDVTRTPEERSAAIASLLAERFTPQEQIRVRALERIAQDAVRR